MNSERTDCLAMVKRVLALGLDYAFVSTPYAGAVWRSKWKDDYVNLQNSNVGVRGRKDACGALTAFAIRVTDDHNLQIPLHQTTTYHYLLGFDTLRFEAGTSCTFVFRCDRWVNVTEHKVATERILTGPLKNARLVTTAGWLGHGMTVDSGRLVHVYCEGDELRDIRKLPALLDVLKRTGCVKVLVDSTLIKGPISEGALL